MNDQNIFQISAPEEKDFKDQDLQGRSFKGTDLSGAMFAGADIRGANFTNAILRNANFTGVRAGLETHKVVIFSASMILVSALIGILAGFVGATIGLQFHSTTIDFSAKVLALAVHVSFLLIALRKGITAGFSIFAMALAAAFIVAIVNSAFVPIAGAIAIAIVIDFSVAALTMVAAVVGIMAYEVVNLKIARIVAAGFAIAFTFTLLLSRTSVSGIAIAMTVMILSAYVGWRTLRRREEIRSLGGTLFARWGTSFRDADLTGADFSQAILKNTDFRRATLTNIRWNERMMSLKANFESQF